MFQVRFLLRCGREDEAQEKEVPRYGNGLISSLFGLTIRCDVYCIQNWHISPLVVYMVDFMYAAQVTTILASLTWHVFSSFLSEHFGSTPWVGKEQNFAVVKRTLEEHASFLMRKLELRDLVAFVKATHFDFTVCKALFIFHVFSWLWSAVH